LNDTYTTYPVYGINYLLGTGSSTVYGLGQSTTALGSIASVVNSGTFQTLGLTTVSGVINATTTISGVTTITTTVTGVTTSTNVIAVSVTAGLAVGQAIALTGSAISNLVAGTYYILTIGTGNITVSTSYGGSTFSVGSTASGSMTLTSSTVTVGSSSSLSAGMAITVTGTTISNLVAGTYYILSVPSSTTICVSTTFGGSLFLLGTTTTGTMTLTAANYITVGSSSGLAVGNEIQITGTAISSLVAGTYYVISIPNSTTITVSTSYGGSIFSVGSTASGSMSINLYTQRAITVAQWNSLFSAMNTLATHTGYTITGSVTTAQTIGNKISALPALITNLNNMAAQAALGCPSTTALTTTSVQQTITSSNPWVNSFTAEHQINFASANAMRYFFNQGGKLNVYMARTANANSYATMTEADATATDLCNGLGTLSVGAAATKITGADASATVSTATTTGFYQLNSSTYTQLCSVSNEPAYTENTLVVSAILVGGSPGTAATGMKIKLVLTNNHSTKTQYTSGNAVVKGGAGATTVQQSSSTVPVYANFIGTCSAYCTYSNPNTNSGLTTVYAPSSISVATNTTA